MRRARDLRGAGQVDPVRPRWQVVEDLFALHCKRLGLNRERDAMTQSTFERPRSQLSLF